MMTTLACTTVMGMMSATWTTVWLMMEVNTMAMCYMLSVDSNNKKMKNMNSMKYFLVQMLASSFIAIMVSQQMTNNSTELLLVMSLLIKMGAWPFHYWLMSMMSTIKLENKSTLLLMTWQKILPSSILSVMTLDTKTKMMVLTLSLMSLMLPLVKMKHMKNSMMMALSSLHNNSWILISAIISFKTLIIMLILYSSAMMMTMNTLSKKSNSMMNSIPMMLSSLAMMANLSGMPPMSMFWMKIMVIMESIQKSMSASVMALLLTMSCVMLTIYLMMMIPMFMKYNNKTQNNKGMEMNNSMKAMLQVSLLSTLVMMMVKVS
uniref:NADH-ubiquinone oxidoreductase chain 2 n=1 Tax=Histiostoma blomquisti TaxID=1902798 RepID=A0A342Y130_9ACAR|nr:NADH dehydrogenase subunit 2 [Histiostoma blomquisti]AOR08482.1 NADH dehydrogenase subunit 2 [Histiostoma blomquisti]